jgi:hypothetical protein
MEVHTLPLEIVSNRSGTPFVIAGFVRLKVL